MKLKSMLDCVLSVFSLVLFHALDWILHSWVWAFFLSFFPRLTSHLKIGLFLFLLWLNNHQRKKFENNHQWIYFPSIFFLMLARCQTANIILKLQVLFKFSKYFSCIFINILSKFVLSRWKSILKNDFTLWEAKHNFFSSHWTMNSLPMIP